MSRDFFPIPLPSLFLPARHYFKLSGAWAGGGGLRGLQPHTPTKKKEKRERGEEGEKKKEKRGMKRERKLNESFQEQVVVGL